MLVITGGYIMFGRSLQPVTILRPEENPQSLNESLGKWMIYGD